ncbi:MAG: HAMP domain-containing histidine kinase, partial [Deltaproteobacteria bacterium]|nr:HAMP domain-containing histidine kinase [Deltaproteobacteria bacterium]
DGYAVITFQDTGTGVPGNIAEYIFDAFYTTTQYHEDEIVGPGSGLGLKIVSDIASANGGFVRLEEPEAGFSCRFDFGVPISDKQVG